MRALLLFISSFLYLSSVSLIGFGQAPALGTTEGFALFTANGAFSNVGIATNVTGDVGNNAGTNSAFPPGTLTGNTHWIDAVSAQAAIDVGIAFSNFSTAGIVLGTPLEIPGLITPGVYSTGGAASLDGDLILDAEGNSDAIFVININGGLEIGTSSVSQIILTNSASLCNVYWQINGEFTLDAGSVFWGTIISSGAIHLLEGASLYGRGLTTAGAIDLHNNMVSYPLPALAGDIAGDVLVCQGESSVNYTVPLINNATDYLWTLPTGATITSGNNTNSITVTYSASAASGDFSVQGSNSCGTGPVSAYFSVVVEAAPVTSDVHHY